MTELHRACQGPLDAVPLLTDVAPEEKPVAPAANRGKAQPATTQPNAFQAIESASSGGRSRREAARDRRGTFIPWIAAGSVAACALVGGVLLWALHSPSPSDKPPSASSRQHARADKATPVKRDEDKNAPQPSEKPLYDSRRVADSEKTPVEYTLSPTVRMVFCWIPAGKSRLGAPPSEDKQGGHEDETEHAYSTLGFWLGKFEVTQVEWLTVMGKSPSNHDGQKPKVHSGWANTAAGMDTSRFPVENISWKDAQQFIEALNARGDERYSEWQDVSLCRRRTSGSMPAGAGKVMQIRSTSARYWTGGRRTVMEKSRMERRHQVQV